MVLRCWGLACQSWEFSALQSFQMGLYVIDNSFSMSTDTWRQDLLLERDTKVKATNKEGKPDTEEKSEKAATDNKDAAEKSGAK
eukprot:258149-Amphidinium_carterae.1